MFNDALTKNTLAPLILRLALAAVLLFHGHSKILDKANNWGADWAVNAWHQQGKLPAGVEQKLDALAKEKKKDAKGNEAEPTEDEKKSISDVKRKLEFAYTRDTPKTPEVIEFPAVQLAVAWGEVVGGIALLLGFLTRLAALGEIIIQIGAIYTVTWHKGFSFAEGGYEFNAVLLSLMLVLFLTGGGLCSVDNLLFKKKEPTPVSAPPGTAGS